MSDRTIVKLVVAGILCLVATVLCFFMFEIVTVGGNEIGVKETWGGGVEETPLGSKTYFLFPGFSQAIYKYDLGTRIFVMNDVPSAEEKVSEGRELDAYQVQSSEGQDMWVSLNVRWRLDPTKVVNIHKTMRTNIEEKLIRPVVMRIVKDECTTRKAIEAYSGDGLVKLQAAIQEKLIQKEGELAQNGVIVDNFVIEKIKLHPEYIGQITARQVAQQQQLRAVEETKAAEAMALKAQAEAKSDLNRRVVEAERDKQVAILNAQQIGESQVIAAKADAERVGLAAKADASKVTIAADAERDAAVARATAIEALGKAEAEAQRLKLSAYAVPGADAFVKIEVAKHMAEAFKGVNGYLPSDMSINLLSDNFLKSINGLMGKDIQNAQPAVQPGK